MRVEREWLRSIVFGKQGARRFTQDSPILPDVWLVGGVQFSLDPARRLDLLLSPHREQTAGALGQELRNRLKANTEEPRGVERERGNDQFITRNIWTIAVSQVAVAVSLTLDELITAALPLTPWWNKNRDALQASAEAEDADETAEVRWMRQIVGVLKLCASTQVEREGAAAPDTPWFETDRLESDPDADEGTDPLSDDPAVGGSRATVEEYAVFRKNARDHDAQRREFRALVRRALTLDHATGRTPRPEAGARKSKSKPGQPPSRSWQPDPELWSVGLNRRARPAIFRSVSATKADAARRLFAVDCRDLTWAVVDSGIDARHPAFRKPDAADGQSQKPRAGAPRGPEMVPGERIKASYDFTRLRTLVTLDSHPNTGPSSREANVDLEKADRAFKQMRRRLRSGQALDWVQLEPLLRISHEEDLYRTPGHDHGTHVAGILAAREIDIDGERCQGMCPDINLYDLRVLDANGKGDEFSIIAALQFIRYLNSTSDQPVINGVNLSLSLIHDVENFACGRTPICEECERLVASGVVVVAAAGNRGFERVLTGAGELDAYRAISITDPGNADGVITVGATHRFQPHTYGVSYFSSRGPTGDGRLKPDVLAPGERVYSCVFDSRFDAKDGTSQAAPHVSGVAAMLMARHREFLGQPALVKKIIMKTATDLGRERYFQGSGMVDALRALQSV